MELIPILATIILMATISTFFLAIGAYILYKIREKQGASAVSVEPATIQAELMTPEVASEVVPVVEHVPVRAPRVFERVPTPAPEPIFVQSRLTQPAPQPVQQRAEAPKPGPAPVQAKPGEQKFLKYTSDGYVSTRDDKKQQGAVKWR
jgi:hypothetical protein